jgi:hypothetical protein
VCLSPTDQWHGCQHSSSQGTLDAVFLRLDGLGVSEAQQVIVSGSDSMSINYPYCVKNAGGPGVSSCQGFDMSTPVLDYGWDVAFAVSSAGSNTSSTASVAAASQSRRPPPRGALRTRLQPLPRLSKFNATNLPWPAAPGASRARRPPHLPELCRP